MLKRRKFKFNIKKSLKHVGLTGAVLIGCLVGIIVYYGFDWKNLAELSFYQNLANPSVRIIRIQEGLRKEEIAEVIGDKLGWNDREKNQFVNLHLALKTDDFEGHYFPKTYMLGKNDDPLDVGNIMFEEFSKQTSKVKKQKSTQIINPDTALKIASIIQREAGGKSDMKLISGIIWNRIFNGMKLQIDATLQYAKGSEEEGWWEQVDPSDKKIDSLYEFKVRTIASTRLISLIVSGVCGLATMLATVYLTHYLR